MNPPNKLGIAIAYGSFDARALASTRTRAEVLAELSQARAAGRRLSQGDRS